MKISLLLLVLCFNSLVHAEEQNPNQIISESYPKTRYATSIYSVLFGGMAIWKGTDELTRDKPASQDTLGTITVLVGATRMVDGTVGLLRPYKVERMAKANQIQDRETLEKLAQQGMYSRIMRSSLIAINSVTFLALYKTKEPEYKPLVYPGVIMAIIATANLIYPSPEERALKKTSSDLSFDFVPVKQGAMLASSFTF